MAVPITSDLAGYQAFWMNALVGLISAQVLIVVLFCLFLYALKYDWI